VERAQDAPLFQISNQESDSIDDPLSLPPLPSLTAYPKKVFQHFHDDREALLVVIGILC
jgi:hypothetical protein